MCLAIWWVTLKNTESTWLSFGFSFLKVKKVFKMNYDVFVSSRKTNQSFEGFFSCAKGKYWLQFEKHQNMHIKVKAAGLTGSDTLFYNLIFIYIWKTLRLQMKTIPEQHVSVIARIRLHFLKLQGHTRGGTLHKTRLLKSYNHPAPLSSMQQGVIGTEFLR